MGTRESCAYVTQGWSVHDDRWINALANCGFDVNSISLERDGLSIDEVRGRLAEWSGAILAGPLTTVTRGLIGISARITGLSWGFDLIYASQRSEELRWLRDLDSLIVDSRHTAAIAAQAGLAVARIHSIPWGVDIAKFSPDGEQAELDLANPGPQPQVILSLRALEPLYRVADIISAFALISSDFPHAHLVIGNDGSLRADLKELAASLNLADRISFIGRIEERDLPALMRAASVYVTASEVDGTSVTLLQAMACGIPTVASNTPGNADWVEQGLTGRLFHVGDPSDLAIQLARTLTAARDEACRAGLAQGRAVVTERANWSQNSLKLAQILTAHPK